VEKRVTRKHSIWEFSLKQKEERMTQIKNDDATEEEENFRIQKFPKFNSNGQLLVCKKSIAQVTQVSGL
jgi:hypothetical protein